jgi:hypothetical protein
MAFKQATRGPAERIRALMRRHGLQVSRWLPDECVRDSALLFRLGVFKVVEMFAFGDLDVEGSRDAFKLAGAGVGDHCY